MTRALCTALLLVMLLAAADGASQLSMVGTEPEEYSAAPDQVDGQKLAKRAYESAKVVGHATQQQAAEVVGKAANLMPGAGTGEQPSQEGKAPTTEGAYSKLRRKAGDVLRSLRTMPTDAWGAVLSKLTTAHPAKEVPTDEAGHTSGSKQVYDRASGKVQDTVDGAQGHMQDAYDTMTGAGQHLEEQASAAAVKAQSAGYAGQEKVTGMTEDVAQASKSTARQMYDGITGKLGDLKRAGEEQLGNMYGSASVKAHQTKDDCQAQAGHAIQQGKDTVQGAYDAATKAGMAKLHELEQTCTDRAEGVVDAVKAVKDQASDDTTTDMTSEL